MKPVSITAEAFERDPGPARAAAVAGPVFITKSGRPTHVLMTAAEFERLTGRCRTLWDAFAGRDFGGDGGDFEIQKVDIRLRPPSFDDQ
ncbi:type II toxin-antitoxin system prevent-host-death family antitoxin [Sphingobium yanoikuyae]|mgnify:CR=1 FL=1|jgi:prevent-host-death family protein|uniref:type II toxin-antitoxin system prevent-host-death family antitoxin n=1 Tax=Sphingobium yanoikuyae TaxID=13690 RepID=UPI0035C81991